MNVEAVPGATLTEPAGSVRSDQWILSVANLCLSFDQTAALNGASLSLLPGEVVALTGPSGSGKSTLLHCAAGLLVPSAGTVTFDGTAVNQLTDEERTSLRLASFGFVFQFGSLVPELSAQENVALPLRLRGQPKQVAHREAKDWLARLGVDDIADQRPGTMSGGQAQRVAVARALVARPRVIFADEPTGALDRANGIKVVDALVSLAREHGAAVLLVTHDIEVAGQADRHLRMRDGVVASEGAE